MVQRSIRLIHTQAEGGGLTHFQPMFSQSAKRHLQDVLKMSFQDKQDIKRKSERHLRKIS